MEFHPFKSVVHRLLRGTGVQLDGPQPWDLQVRHPRFYRRALRGSLGIGGSYMDGDWNCADLAGLFRRVLSAGQQDNLTLRMARAWRTLRARLTNLQTRRRSMAVAEEHYNLDHRMYSLFLGPWNQYTCCFFDGTDDLEHAERIKLEMICDKLGLQPGHRLLDIGCGWGGLARYAAATRGCAVTGISLSTEQIDYARQYTQGLPVEILKLDYRDLPAAGIEPFDRISIVGMIEHVGYKNYRQLMQVVHRMLKPDGQFLLHTIGNFEETAVADPWFEKYIFRNSMIPSMAQLARSVEGLFVVEDWENYGQDYVRTLRAWYDNFNRNWPQIQGLEGIQRFDERFRRMWNYYLQSSEAAFAVEHLHLWHLVMTPRGSGRGVYDRVRHQTHRNPIGAPA